MVGIHTRKGRRGAGLGFRTGGVAGFALAIMSATATTPTAMATTFAFSAPFGPNVELGARDHAVSVSVQTCEHLATSFSPATLTGGLAFAYRGRPVAIGILVIEPLQGPGHKLGLADAAVAVRIGGARATRAVLGEGHASDRDSGKAANNQGLHHIVPSSVSPTTNLTRPPAGNPSHFPRAGL